MEESTASSSQDAEAPKADEREHALLVSAMHTHASDDGSEEQLHEALGGGGGGGEGEGEGVSGFVGLNPFTGQPASEWYVRRSVVSRPGEFYWVNRSTGAISWSCPEANCSSPPVEVDDGSNAETLVEFQGLLAANVLDTFECCHFGQRNEGVRSLWVIGGTHGNEPNGIVGVRLLQQFLKQLEFSLSRWLRSNASISCVDCINPVGQAASARSCPNKESVLQMHGNVVEVEPSQRGSNPPVGWQDPNRGWDINQTMVKTHLDDIMQGRHSRRPDFILFTHDWAAFLPIVGFYYPKSSPHRAAAAAAEQAEEGGEEMKAAAGTGKASPATEHESALKQLLMDWYPQRTGFGKPWQFTKSLRPNNTLCSAMAEKYDIPIAFAENYIGRADGGLIHLSVALFLLCKECALPLSDLQLLALIRKETKIFYQNHCSASSNSTSA